MKQSIICPRFEKAISLLSQRWTALIINQILSGSHRFSTLEYSIGISGKVLSERLKNLEQKGIIKREVIPETPVIIEYSLTEKGFIGAGFERNRKLVSVVDGDRECRKLKIKVCPYLND